MLYPTPEAEPTHTQMPLPRHGVFDPSRLSGDRQLRLPLSPPVLVAALVGWRPAALRARGCGTRGACAVPRHPGERHGSFLALDRATESPAKKLRACSEHMETGELERSDRDFPTTPVAATGCTTERRTDDGLRALAVGRTPLPVPPPTAEPIARDPGGALRPVRWEAAAGGSGGQASRRRCWLLGPSVRRRDGAPPSSHGWRDGTCSLRGPVHDARGRLPHDRWAP